MIAAVGNLLLTLLCLLLTQDPSFSGARPKQSDLEFTVAVISNTVARGQQPEFFITIRNKSENHVMVSDLPRRADWPDDALDIAAWKDEKEIPYRILISDPGWLTGSDYLTIPSHDCVACRILTHKKKFVLQEPGLYRVKSGTSVKS